MPCDTQFLPGQTLSQRKEEVKKAVTLIDRLVAQRLAKVTVGPQGAVAFSDIPEQTRSRVTDSCIYRRIMTTGSALAKAEIARAEQLAGRSVSKQVVGQGHHSHDGGKTWSSHKG